MGASPRGYWQCATRAADNQLGVKMVKNRELSAEEIVAGIQERIDLLTKVQMAVRIAFTGNVTAREPERVQVRTATKRRVTKRKRNAPKGASRDLILKALQETPKLTTGEIYDRLVNSGEWVTHSVNPRGLVTVTLDTMLKKGLISKNGNGWMIPGREQETVAA